MTPYAAAEFGASFGRLQFKNHRFIEHNIAAARAKG
jgi:hypothetical protein